jgi:glycerol kinase
MIIKPISILTNYLAFKNSFQNLVLCSNGYVMKMEHYVIGLDQGTTGTTALLFDANQNIIEKTYAEHSQHFPQIGWVEHDPEEIFENVVSLISKLLKKASVQASQIKGLGITNQRETFVVWDKATSRPVYPAIVWQCRRTSDECIKLKKNSRFENQIQKLTGLTIDPYFSATKLAWLFRNIKPSSTSLAFGTIDTWLIWNLTRGTSHVTDVTNASRTLLFDINKQQWSKKLCNEFKIPMEILPKVQPSIGNFGRVHKSFFGSEIPILGVLGDQQASLYAHGASKPFQAKCTFGTGAFALVHTGNKPILSKHKLLTTLACSSDTKPQYAIEGSVFMAGSIIQWLRDEMKLITRAEEMDELAKQLTSNEGVYLVPAFTGMGAPYWKSDAKALLSGMHLGTNRSHVARAALESIAYQVNDLFVAIEKDIKRNIRELHVDGGVTQSKFLMQFLADVLQVPVHKSSMFEMTAFGAAKAAAASINFWNYQNSKLPTEIFKPSQSASAMRPNLNGWKNAVGMLLKK